MIIDCHSHLVPDALLAEIAGRTGEFPAIRPVLGGGGPTR